ncbi:hypothetical protein A0H81_10265 [Grifola frondosa]|uniref:Uncharacterized protein n=1 Tax=Grifola frondosa TaxID=5627 RepID=A0A1C7LZH6_GRIFR|nr:hypothetical protein A0H81_10265 [Grifola frondosa]
MHSMRIKVLLLYFSFPHLWAAPLSPAIFFPSVVFVILYALILPVVAWRMITPRSRTLALLGTILFSVERIIVYSLRIAEAHSAKERVSEGLVTYMQTTFGAGFISIGHDVVTILRSMLVTSTQGTPVSKNFRDDESLEPLTSLPGHAAPSHSVSPSIRMSFSRTSHDGAFGSVACIDYKQAINSGFHAALTQQLRYASTAVALFLIIGVNAVALWAYFAMPRIPRNSALLVFAVSLLLCIVGAYRMIVMRFSTTSLLSTAPGSLNSPGSKRTFYLFHVLPEFLTAAILLSVNVKRIFATGMFGDVAYRDKNNPVVLSRSLLMTK